MRNKTIELSNAQIVTISASKLGGVKQLINLEDIAITAYKISPIRFSWKKYSERIDLRPVYDALKDATRTQPPLLKGGAKRGYMLTSEGKRWVENIDDKEFEVVDRTRKYSDIEWIETERSRLRKTSAYAKWESGQSSEITLREFQEFIRVNEYFPSHLREERYIRMKNVIEDDNDLKHLFSFLLQVFGKELS